ncbi:glycosyltransferase family 2 protein [Aliarcobacter cryaerophilus]|uniref:glycosyltransferase family 2 protein n=1 Tax=Aliarcobacter cryaerophilus TaxID=28198 RepID=UPI0021B4760A|nr:glycosyltransferase family A protein [Aliarcobacter cryaerophilus]MCT7464728.1 glycosyltransferase family 2 protein [Aliarcobacter cryaerophilus]
MKISTIIPMYNSKDTIKSAIESVLNQTYKEPLEIIVVNDGSKDGCEKIVEEMILNNQRNRTIKLINKENGGVSSARNRGIKEASGEWIALLDSDDIWLPEKLQKQVDEINKNSNIKFIGTNRNGELYPFFKKSENPIYSLNAKEIIAKWYPHTSTAFINKEVLLKTNLYDETRTHAEDGDLWLRIAQYCDLYVLNEDLVYTGGGKRSFGESGLSANMPKMYEGEILALKGTRKRKQINLFEYLGFYLWLTLKYYRRILIVKSSK